MRLENCNTSRCKAEIQQFEAVERMSSKCHVCENLYNFRNLE